MDAKKLRTRTLSLLAVVVLLSLLISGYTAPETSSTTKTLSPSGPTVRLGAASGKRITFKEQTGPAAQSSSREGREVPHLVLRRNGALTAPDERTLTVEVGGVTVPPPGITVTLHVETQHGDPDIPATIKGSGRIPVWRETRWIANSSAVAQSGARVVFTRTFEATVISGTETIATPTDYFRYDVSVIAGDRPITRSTDALQLNGDYAFLMEDQHIAQLPEVREASVGAAPDELIIYTLDMVPFRKNELDPETWLPREVVPDYVSGELVPRMVEAFRVQTNEWGFRWHSAWTSYRRGEDAERLSVALSDGRTWFHGRAPAKAHSAISIRVTGGDNVRYDTLTDGLMSSFHHELFHNLQRSIQRNAGRRGPLDGAGSVWAFFSEGTAVLASSVGQPHVQLRWSRAYVSRANGYLGRGGPQTDNLNTSYQSISPYRLAIYWRFLYEQCGQTGNGGIDPAAGMEVVRRALTVLYAGDVVDTRTSTDLVRAVSEIMDRALASSPCPFDTHAESLIAFARAVYGLRLEDGQPEAPTLAGRWGFYDPHGVYQIPPVTTIAHSGTDTQHIGEIPNSFGIDLVDVTLAPAVDGQPVTVELRGAPGAAAAFKVQVWELNQPGDGLGLQLAESQQDGPTLLGTANLSGTLSYAIPTVDRAVHDRLGLIITRIDADEHLDPVGAYAVALRSPEHDPVLNDLGSP